MSNKLHVKKDDTVLIISGDDKGQQGKGHADPDGGGEGLGKTTDLSEKTNHGLGGKGQQSAKQEGGDQGENVAKGKK